MAKSTVTTPLAATEDLRKGTYAPTLIASLFSRFLGALAQHIEAERDIQDVDIWDAAFTGWLREAEESLTVVTTFLRQIRDAKVTRASDVPLLRLSVLADALLGSEDPNDFMRARSLLAHPTLFRCIEPGPVGRRVCALIDTALLRLDELADLDAYAPDLPMLTAERELVLNAA
ncbi:hypothetical protein [Pseudorhodobacter sp. MZDSW-24AT]|uniref:hypothetical protein n=1 Tax=Pseudorhodobacter sp. MZDSW-24AT TaxID=2052957 RepID=UPI000C1F131A|nr:hypothetical protein [Pseudorhodobacter sp. MZDSW-24AT]PJF08405.1 hypothetical protein CUR21_13305 [Pseudorhodobacter sp. MZDSW-24AT]